MTRILLVAYVAQVGVGWMWSGLVVRLLGDDVMRADAALHRAGRHPGYLRRRR